LSESRAGPWLEPEQAEPKLILIGPRQPGPELVARLESVLAAAAPAALIIDPAGLAEAERPAMLTELHEIARRAGCALLLQDDPILVVNAGCDGAHLTDPARIEPARRLLGAERILGAACGLSRHDAMVAGESGADYVSFGAIEGSPDHETLAELVRWWSDLFVLPVAVAIRAEVEAATVLVRAGADFVMVGGKLWTETGDLSGELERIAAAISTCRATNGTEPQGQR
jgi:thiamine-phosphate pyrophosphorylase